jgi:cellulose synthase/poly-beta-1,6-N-acetylglucosamine synthase-like glycosyltransferase
VRLTVLIPAHNEELILPSALASLAAQTRRPERVIVISDNSTDATTEVARSHGVEAVETVDNTEKKAGALNQVLASWLPDAQPNDVVMVMDADTTLVPEFLATAVARLEADADLIAVGGVFYGEEGGGLLAQMQRNEFTRYQRYISRRQGRVFVLTGTASLMRAFALSAVAEARGFLIPGPPGKVYDTYALTEDNELTLALKSLGAKLVSPMQCRCVTEIMPSWRALWRQRSRWQRGALENVGAYGLTRTTAPYWGQQLGIGYGTLAFNAYLLLMLITLLAADSLAISLFWGVIGLIFVAERMVTVWAAGWRGRLVSLPMVLELVYAEFLMVVYVKSLVDIALGRASGWNVVEREKVSL